MAALENFRVPITCMIVSFNESARIGYVLDHAVQWADEVVVIDKSSNDGTVEICKSRGEKVRVVSVDFTPQGHDDFISYIQHIRTEWVYCSTCSEIPTRKLVEEAHSILDSRGKDLDLVEVPRRMYSLGSHTPSSPWSVAYYRFLFHKNRAVVSNLIHANINAHPERTARIPYAEDCCVHHLTHVSARRFMEVHLPYVEEEARSIAESDVDRRILECFLRIREQIPGIMKSGERWPEIMSAWCIYQLGLCLFLCERKKGGDARKTYKAIAEDVLNREWGVVRKTDTTSTAPLLFAFSKEVPQEVHQDASRVMKRIASVSLTVYYLRYPREIFRFWRFHLGAIRRRFFQWTLGNKK